MAEPDGPQPSVQLTSWRTVILAGLIGALFGYALFAGLEVFGLEHEMRLPVAAVITIAVVAVVVGWLAYLTYRTIHVRRRTMAGQQAVLLLALGKTTLLAGAALVGGYAAIGLQALPRLDAAFPRERAVAAGLAVVASIVLAVAGRLLERACQVPREPPDDKGATPGELPDDNDTEG